MVQMVAIDAVPADAVEDLLDRAFGSDRHARTAYKLRAGTTAIPALSFALLDGDTLIGSIQCWPLRFDGDDGTVRPMVLVGPVAITPERQQEGFGRRLMEAALDASAAEALPLMLIGDPEYYERFFGFSAAASGAWRLPGPVERHRLLARGADLPTGGGMLGPRITAPVRV